MEDKGKKEMPEERRKGGKEERREDECQTVILELACFPGRRETPRRSKTQSDKSQPTNEQTT